MAVLVRASFQMRAIEDRFIALGLPYRVIGGPRFYERQEMRDAIAYLEVVANPPMISLSSASSTCRSAARRHHHQAHHELVAARAEILSIGGP